MATRAERRAREAARKKAAAGGAEEQKPQPVAAAKNTPRRWLRPRDIWGFLVGVLLSTAANIAQLWLMLPVGPDMRVQSIQLANPFKVKFTAVNPSWLFDMKAPQISCTIDYATGTRGFIAGRNQVEGPRWTGDLAASSKKIDRCHFDDAIGLRGQIELQSARITLRMTYTSLWGWHREAAFPFQWDQDTLQWIEGEEPGSPLRPNRSASHQR